MGVAPLFRSFALSTPGVMTNNEGCAWRNTSVNSAGNCLSTSPITCTIDARR